MAVLETKNMEDGLYKVTFATPMGEGYGVVVLKGGELRGGDSMMYYVGTYSENGGDFSASVDVNVHSQVAGMVSVFGPGVNRVHLDLSGKSLGSGATAKGSSPQAPGVGFSATLAKLA